jgi:vacuolar protein sorting-associated protein 54
VDAAEFRPYLSYVGALYEQLRRVKESEDEEASHIQRRSNKLDDLADILDDSQLRPGSRPFLAARKASIASLATLPSIEAPSLVRRTSSGFGRRGTQGPPPLSTIPNVYFEDDFHLENPRTFDVVSERSEVVRPTPGSVDDKSSSNGAAAAPRKALATNAILQEKLSWYMDTIEVHLINSISTASTTFFAALGELRELHSEAAESIERIKALRQELATLDKEIAVRGLDVVQKRRRQENLRQLNDSVTQLKHIVEGVAESEALVDSGEVEEALNSIDFLELLIAGERDSLTSRAIQSLQLRDLRSATALQGVNNDLSTLRFRIGKAYESKFQSLLLADLQRHVEAVSTQEVLFRWGSASMRTRGHSREPSAFPSYLNATDELRAAILPNIVGLHRARHIATAASTYRACVIREVKNVIRRNLPSSNDDDNESMMSASTMSGGRHLSSQEKSSILARNLRALDPEDAEELLVKIYVGVTETLRRLTTQVKVLLDVASSLGDAGSGGMKSPLTSPLPDRQAPRANNSGFEIQEEIHKTMDVANLLGMAIDEVHSRIIKVLKVRTEQTSKLEFIWFLRYFALNSYFANECESISGRNGKALSNLVNDQIKSFVQQHGDVEKQKLAQGMESDQWNARDFSDHDIILLNRILESSTRDAAAWSEGRKIWIPYAPDEDEVNGEGVAEVNGTSKEKTRTATIEGESFLLPNSAILCLNGLSGFLHLITAMPKMTGEIASSLVAFLQLFNSRCTQLILGAGATRSAGLKNITTKHLALASQALSFIATIIPHIREFVRRHCDSGVTSLIGDFDKVRRLFQEHQNNIYDKLVEIMSGRAMAHSKTLKTIHWDDDKTSSVHAYMETLAKETTTLHRVLTKHLPEGTVHLIMVPVFSSYKDQFGKVFQAAEPKTETGRTG